MSDHTTATATPTVRRTPLHLWVVGALAILWNGFGAFDYLMTQSQNESYMSQFTPEQLEYFYGFPAWGGGVLDLWLHARAMAKREVLA